MYSMCNTRVWNLVLGSEAAILGAQGALGGEAAGGEVGVEEQVL